MKTLSGRPAAVPALCLIAGLLLPAPLRSQESRLGARDLYFSPTPVSQKNVVLGFRYGLLKVQSDGSAAEINPDTIFHSGDRIQLTVEANQNAFLYVVHQGSSGEWFLLEGSPLDLEGNRRYEVPPGGRFYFDDKAGSEKLFLVVSRTRDANLDGLLKGTAPSGDPKSPTQTASNPRMKPVEFRDKSPLDPVLMSSLRLQSRDLVFEKVDGPSKPKDQAAPVKIEKAVYVVNASASSDARVVVDLLLEHR